MHRSVDDVWNNNPLGGHLAVAKMQVGDDEHAVSHSAPFRHANDGASRRIQRCRILATFTT